MMGFRSWFVILTGLILICSPLDTRTLLLLITSSHMSPLMDFRKLSITMAYSSLTAVFAQPLNIRSKVLLF